MRHEQDKIQALLDGELEPAAAARVRGHCAECPECAAALEAARAVWAVLGQTPAPEPGAPAWPGIRAALASRAGVRALRLRFAAGGVAAAVAGLALGLVLGLGRAELARESAAVALSTPGEVEPSAELVFDSASLLADESAPTLERLYFASAGQRSDPGEVAP